MSNRSGSGFGVGGTDHKAAALSRTPTDDWYADPGVIEEG